MADFDIGALMRLGPDGIQKQLLLGDFGQALVAFINKHQKGNRLLMETLTSQPYPLKAVTTQQLYDSTKGKAGAAGITFVLELMQKQQHDVINALTAAVRKGQETLHKAGIQPDALDAPTPRAAPGNGAGSTPAGEEGQGTDDEAEAESEPAVEVVRDSRVRDEAAEHEAKERRRLEDLAQEREQQK